SATKLISVFDLVRVRENGEQIALLRGETAEHVRLMDRFSKVIVNWVALMSRQKKLSFFTTGFQQIAVVFPYLVVSPAYFSGLVQLGGLMQTASAFHSVQSALSFFASSNTYREFAEWRAVIERLEGFNKAIMAGRSAQITALFVSINGGEKVRDIRLKALELWLPTGDPIIAVDRLCPWRSYACRRPIRLGQVDSVPCDRRHLAIRRRHLGSAARCKGDNAAAAALLTARLA